MGAQISFVVDTLKFIQDGRIVTWRTPILAIRYLIKLISEKVGSIQASKMEEFNPEKKGEFWLMTARNLEDVEKAQKVYMQAFQDKYGAVLLEKLFKQFPKSFFILMSGKDMVGYCVYTIEPGIFFQRQTAWLYSLAVDPHFRGGGYGRFLVEKTLNYMVENSVKKVYLHVYNDNAIGIKLYESLGFSLKRLTKEINPKREQMSLMETRIDGHHYG